MKFSQNIGDRIKSLRLQKGWSQAYLAEKSNIDSRNLSRLETGKAKPKLSTIISLSNALCVTPNDILLYDFNENQAALTKELIRLISNLSDENKKKAIDYINYLQS
jgi:transcriptional regulator with XRE-family HTH domain